MPRKGIATVKKTNKYVYVDENNKEITPPSSDKEADSHKRTSSAQKRVRFSSEDSENANPIIADEHPKLSIPVQSHKAEQPRQDSAIQGSATLANSLFPNEPDDISSTTGHETQNPISESISNEQERTNSDPRQRKQGHSNSRPRIQDNAPLANRAQTNQRKPTNSTQQRSQHPVLQANDAIPDNFYPDTMIQGGASIPPNQQRNMRACMVCSIVRTQQQFMTQGCPNCEELLELAGNPEQINDCTSQVFEGLISVADTKRSWVARYQRLEGYVPGVYATQVEGILPEDVLVAVENAGINYVPRDGSEQEMLGKD